jgi:hypothetical protein
MAFVGLLLVLSPQLPAQVPAIYFRLIVSDNGTGIDTLYFGFDPRATDCLDTLFGEQIITIPPSGVFDARLVDSCTPGGMKINIHYLDGENPEDSFRLIFQPGIGGFPFHFCWTLISGRSMLSSVNMKDPFGFGIINVDMMADGCTDLTNSAFSSLLITTHLGIDDVKPGGSFPDRFDLRENYPNPFNPSTTLQYDVREYAYVELEVRDLPGRLVKRLVARDLTPATYSVVWDGTDESGRNVVSGVYYVRMTASPHSSTGRSAPFQATRKLMLVR